MQSAAALDSKVSAAWGIIFAATKLVANRCGGLFQAMQEITREQSDAPQLCTLGPSSPIRQASAQTVAIVLRVGSRATRNCLEVQSSYQNVVDRNEADVIYGFRCAVTPTPSADLKDE
jgi:hypothetical protein